MLLASKLNELFFILVHLDASLVEPSAWVHDAREGVIVAILSETRSAFTSVQALHGFVVILIVSLITHFLLGSLPWNL